MDLIGNQDAEKCVGSVSRAETIEEKLSRKKLQLENELQQVNTALEQIAKNPEIITCINLVTRGLRGY